MLILQGLPAHEMNFGRAEAHHLYDLAGEAMCCPCVASIMLAFFLNPLAEWWEA
jgi:hypothetical protein